MLALQFLKQNFRAQGVRAKWESKLEFLNENHDFRVYL